jgi:serine protease Do
VRQGGHTFVSKPDPQSFFGVNEFQNTEDGVIVGSIDVPNGPADKAGLIGGDVLVKFDGREVKDEDQMEELMASIPTGKTVEVEYLRDGEKKTAQLTTASRDDSRRFAREFERRPEGRGQFGYDDDDVERVKVPGMNIYGVRLDTIMRSLPADMAGVKKRDIVIEFDGVPIRTTDEFLMRVRRALPYSTVKVVVMRPTSGEENAPLEKIEIPVKMGKQ